jgi:hypothetical protein
MRRLRRMSRKLLHWADHNWLPLITVLMFLLGVVGWWLNLREGW